MPRKGENIYKRKDGRWEGRFLESYTPDGKGKYHSVYATSYTEVKEKLNGFNNQMFKSLILRKNKKIKSMMYNFAIVNLRHKNAPFIRLF